VDASIVNRLCCPICSSDLRLTAFEVESVEQEGGVPADNSSTIRTIVRDGLLLCDRCKVWYPIYSYVPVLLTFETALHRKFARTVQPHMRAIDGYSAPSGSPQPGEESIQQSFTEEWDQVQDSDLSFVYSEEELKTLNREVWLTWLKDAPPIRNILNVGCGLGRESIALQSVAIGSEVFAIDLNFGLLESGRRLKEKPALHFIIASLFALPFKGRQFDLVYSQGVIHHTFSTHQALVKLSKHVAPGGFMFVWVYALDDHLVSHGLRGIVTRTEFFFESLVRPVVARLPEYARRLFFLSLTLALHPLIKGRVRNKKSWTLANTNHDLRDWLSHRYAYRHSYNELIEDFEDLGFQIVAVQSPASYRRHFNRPLWGVGLTGRMRQANESK